MKILSLNPKMKNNLLPLSEQLQWNFIKLYLIEV